MAGDLGRPAADVARTPAEWPARPVPDWRTIDPHDYQPRPFGPMETDPDWVDPDGAADADDARAAGRASGSPAGHAKGRASDPWAEEDEEVCWNCGQEVEFFSPGGRAWCSFCLEGEPDADWRDLVALLPSRWPRPREEPRHLAVFAASACHEAGRPNYAVSWPWSPFLEVRSAKALFHQLGDLLRSPEAWRRRTAEAILGEIAASEGMNARLPGHPRPPAGSIIPPHPVAD